MPSYSLVQFAPPFYSWSSASKFHLKKEENTILHGDTYRKTRNLEFIYRQDASPCTLSRIRGQGQGNKVAVSLYSY
jgi:hypothetical protein